MKSEVAGKTLKYTNESVQQSAATSGARKWFWLNVSSNISYTITQAAISLWLTPYLIGYLGIAAYGMLPLVNSFTSYLAVFTSAFTSSTTRFLSIDLDRNDVANARRSFNTALFSVVGVCLGLLPIAVVVSITFPYLFDVPKGWERDTSFLFATVAGAFFITVVGSIFAISTFANNRFFMGTMVNYMALAARLAFIVIVFTLFVPRLWYAGAGLLIAASVTLLGDILLWRKLTPKLNIQWGAFDRTRLSNLIGLGGWVLVNQFGGMLISNSSDIFIVNLAFGAVATGGFGLMLQLSALFQSLVGTASTVVRPVILQKYAVADYLGLQALSSQSVKFMGLGLALPVGLICGFAGPFLFLWLGSPFQDLSALLVMTIIHLGVNLSTRPLQYTLNAYNKVKWPGIITIISGVIEISIATIVAFWGGWGILGVALITAIFWTIRNALYMPWYTARVMQLPWWSFYPSLTAGVLGTLGVGITSYVLSQAGHPYTWQSLFIYGITISLLYMGVLWLFGLSHSDKQLITRLIPWQVLRQTDTEKLQ